MQNSGTIRKAGFTLVELLVVVAVIAILAALLLPVLGRAKKQAQAVYCLNNGHSLMLALHLYASDNAELLPPNDTGVDLDVNQHLEGGVPGWVSGISCDGCYGCVTNPMYLSNPKYAKLAPYAGNIGVYKCPGDTGAWLGSNDDPKVRFGRVRSYSMNWRVGTVVWWAGMAGEWSWDNWVYVGDLHADPNPNGPNDPLLQQFGTELGKMTDFPHPSHLAVFMEEDEHTIVTPSLGVPLEPEDQENDDMWQHAPGPRHDGQAMYAFGDAHSELHAWHPFPVHGTAPHERWNYWLYRFDYFAGWTSTPKTGTPQARDFAWLSDHLECLFP